MVHKRTKLRNPFLQVIAIRGRGNYIHTLEQKQLKMKIEQTHIFPLCKLFTRISKNIYFINVYIIVLWNVVETQVSKRGTY